MFWILDDVLSGLDPETTETILTNLFKSDGLFRRTNRNVVLATVNSKPFSRFRFHEVTNDRLCNRARG